MRRKSHDSLEIKKLKNHILKDHLCKIKQQLSGESISCFISYAWDLDEQGQQLQKHKLQRLSDYLEAAGIRVFLDLKDNSNVDSSISNFIDNIDSVTYIILVVSDLLIEKFFSLRYSVVQREIKKIKARFSKNRDDVIGIKLDKNILHINKLLKDEILKDFFKDKVIQEYNNDFNDYVKTTLDLLKCFSPANKKQNIVKIINRCNSIIDSISQSQPEVLLGLSNKYPEQIENLLKKGYIHKFNLNKVINFEKICQWDLYVPLVKIGSNDKYCIYKDLIEEFNEKGKHIFIQGECGTGKSTLCKSIVYLWASNKKLLDFDLVLFINLSSLNHSSYPYLPDHQYEIIDVIVKECFLHSLSEIDKFLLKQYLSYNNYKILWIIDESDRVEAIAKDLQEIYKSIIASPYVIFTCTSYPEEPLYYQITKFDEIKREKFIDCFFNPLNNNYAKNNLLMFLSSNPFVGEICFIPMCLEFVCNIWLNFSMFKYKAGNNSITSLYQEILTLMLKRVLIEKERLHKDMFCIEYEISNRFRSALSIIKEIAFITHKRNEVFFTREELEKLAYKFLYSPLKVKELSWLIKHTMQIGVIVKEGDCFKFIDPSLKMFFVSKYLIERWEPSAALSESEQLKTEFDTFFRTYKYTKNNEILFSFVAGLTSSLNKNNSSVGELAINKISKVFWNNILNYSLDFIGIKHMYLILKCLKESDYNEIFNENPELKLLICKNLPNIFNYISLYKITETTGIFLLMFNNPILIEIMINLDLLEITVDFISSSDFLHRNILSNLIADCSLNYSEAIVNLVRKKLLMASNLENCDKFTYLANSIKILPTNVAYLIDLLRNPDLTIRRTVLNIIQEQMICNEEIIDALSNLAITLDLDLANLSESVQIIYDLDKKQSIQKNIHILEDLSCLRIDVLDKIFCGQEALYKVIDRIHEKIRPNSIIVKKMRSIGFLLNSHLKSKDEDYELLYEFLLVEEDFSDHINSFSDSETSEVTVDSETNDFNINNQTKIENLCSCGDKTVFSAQSISNLSEYDLNFLICNNIFLLKTPIINLLSAYDMTPSNILIGILIIKRLIFNFYNEVITINNGGINVYTDKIDLLQIDDPDLISRYENLTARFSQLYNFQFHPNNIENEKTETYDYDSPSENFNGYHLNYYLTSDYLWQRNQKENFSEDQTSMSIANQSHFYTVYSQKALQCRGV